MLTIRLSDEEEARMIRLARHYGLQASSLVRMLLKREEDYVVKASQNEIDRRGK